jgi:hypothetical protein
MAFGSGSADLEPLSGGYITGPSSALGLELYCPFLKNHKDYSGYNKHFFTTKSFSRTNASTDYVNPDVGSFEKNEKFSIGGWFTANQDLAEGGIYTLLSNMQISGPTANGYSLFYNEDSGQPPKISILLSAYDGSIDYGFISCSWIVPNIYVGQAHHCFVTYDGSEQGNGFEFYLNGVKLQRELFFTFPFSVSVVAHNFKLMNGARPAPWTNVGSFFGKCNFLRIYRSQLTNKHIAQIYNSEFAQLNPNKFREKVPYPTVTNFITLYLNAHATEAEFCTLYLRGSEGTEVLNETTLYLDGSITIEDSITLVVYSKDEISNNIPLYLYGTFYHDESLYLFAKADTEQGEGIPLFLEASLADNVAYADLSLFAKSFEVPTYEESLLLYLEGSTQEEYAESLILFVEGAYPIAANGVNLYVSNTQLGVEDTITLYVKGDGLYDGFHPYGEGMALYIERWPSAAITMYCAAPGTAINTSLPLLSGGYATVEQGVDLVIKDVVGQPTRAVTLFTHGF